LNTKFTPLVSIVIPTYNQANYLGKALQSVLDQTHKNWEAIIIDNHSTDNTNKVILKYNDSRFKYIKIHNHGIIAKSRNAGILLAKGEWIAFLDSDDWWKSDKLTACLNCINEDVSLIYHDLEIISNKTQYLRRRRIVKTRKLKTPILIDLLVRGNAISNSSTIVRKKMLKKIGLIDEHKDLIAAEDFNTWLRIAKQTDQFKLLDPRGEYGSWYGTMGDNIYDWAKLAHDCYYGYNAIVADVPQNEYVKDLFLRKLDEYNLPKEQILMGGLLLLATCIPLHYDDVDRQTRMLTKVMNEIQ